jgi:hypothetical protein
MWCSSFFIYTLLHSPECWDHLAINPITFQLSISRNEPVRAGAFLENWNVHFSAPFIGTMLKFIMYCHMDMPVICCKFQVANFIIKKKVPTTSMSP